MRAFAMTRTRTNNARPSSDGNAFAARPRREIDGDVLFDRSIGAATLPMRHSTRSSRAALWCRAPWTTHSER